MGPVEQYMVRSYSNFRKDLKTLYDLGFRPITLAEYVDNSFSIGPGASPVVITFDDSSESQFFYTKSGAISPNSAVGIWKSFADQYPDFPVKGTWFILPNGPFGTKSTGKKKVEQLISWGSEIASHTMTHRPLDRLTDNEVKQEMARSIVYIKGLTGKAPRTMALPYGNIPKNRSLLHGFTLDNNKYWFDAVVLAGSGAAPPPNNPNRNLKLLPRILAYPGELGVTYYLDRVRSGAYKPLVVE
ncbi:MAG: polysaccharide deacetylase family protein [Fimbriimonadaceae bacterium]|nr:polysaccharide deacetylase family protein [Fimbriimonadaceae bacterium]QYK56761.1 MAG: polysaccharide deacetylase family protein [Fimbriimonadaceae bacterium]